MKETYTAKKIFLIALTGGIGSGKTTVLNFFKEKGVPCYVADEQAKKLMLEDKDLVNAIKNEFGKAAYTKDHKLNTDYLSNEVFNDEVKLKKINSIVHPVVRNHFKDWVKKQNFPFVIYESALVFETNQQHFFDDIILVSAPVEERIKRVIERSGLAENDIKKRINKQMDDNLKVEGSRYIIKNIKIEETKLIVDNIYHKILNKY